MLMMDGGVFRSDPFAPHILTKLFCCPPEEGACPQTINISRKLPSELNLILTCGCCPMPPLGGGKGFRLERKGANNYFPPNNFGYLSISSFLKCSSIVFLKPGWLRILSRSVSSSKCFRSTYPVLTDLSK